jgi:predicted transcriptional regulator
VRSYAVCEDYEPAPESTDSLPLFAPPELRTMARPDGDETSKAAALRIVDSISDLQRRIYEVFLRYGNLTGKEVEQLAEFEDLAPSTARKRLTDLRRAGWLRPTKEKRAGCRAYEAVKR